MEYQIELLEKDSTFLVRTRGLMTGDDFLVMAEDLLRQKKSPEEYAVIFDHSQLDFSRVSVEELDRIRAFHCAHDAEIGTEKCAIVLKPGCAAQWEKLWAQGQKIETGNVVRLFEDSRQALAWVGPA